QLLSKGIPAVLLALLCGACEDIRVDLECPSPDQQYVAVYYSDFGSAAGYAYQKIDLRQVKRFMGLWPRSVRLMDLSDGFGLRLIWKGSRHLLVEYPPDAYTDVWKSGRIALGKELIEVEYRRRADRRRLIDNECVANS